MDFNDSGFRGCAPTIESGVRRIRGIWESESLGVWRSVYSVNSVEYGVWESVYSVYSAEYGVV